jgi:hypothetical protein
MEICNSFHTHEEVCYDSSSCPLCEAFSEINRLQDLNAELENKIMELKNENS